MGKRFYAVHTHPGREFFTTEELTKQQIEVLPTTYVHEYLAGRRHHFEPRQAERQLFPTYVVVRLDVNVDRWRCVNGTRGVVRMLGPHPEHPAAIPDNFIVPLLQECAAGKYDIRLPKPDKFAIGDHVHLREEAQFLPMYDGHVTAVRKKWVEVQLSVGSKIPWQVRPSQLQLVPA